MRAASAHLTNPFSLGAGLPAMLREGGLAEVLIDAFDAVLAPVHHTMDCTDAYLDPALTPPDFLPWLAGWVGITLDERWSVERQRAFASRAVDLYRWRGTVRGIADAIELYAGVRPEIEESGGVSWGRQPGGDIPGEARPHLVVRVPTGNGELDVESLSRIVAEAKPAHVPHTVEVAGRRTTAGR